VPPATADVKELHRLNQLGLNFRLNFRSERSQSWMWAGLLQARARLSQFAAEIKAWSETAETAGARGPFAQSECPVPLP